MADADVGCAGGNRVPLVRRAAADDITLPHLIERVGDDEMLPVAFVTALDACSAPGFRRAAERPGDHCCCRRS